MKDVIDKPLTDEGTPLIDHPPVHPATPQRCAVKDQLCGTITLITIVSYAICLAIFGNECSPVAGWGHWDSQIPVCTSPNPPQVCCTIQRPCNDTDLICSYSDWKQFGGVVVLAQVTMVTMFFVWTIQTFYWGTRFNRSTNYRRTCCGHTLCCIFTLGLAFCATFTLLLIYLVNRTILMCSAIGALHPILITITAVLHE